MAETGQYVQGSLWFYAPNKGAPLAFALFFAISMIWHIYQCFRYKCWKVTGLLPWSACIFVAGYIMREIGAFDYDNLPVFIASLVLIYAAPPIYELSNYFMLSRILYYVPYHSPIHPGRVFSTFGFISAIIESLNANGAALVANSSLPESRQNIGKALLKSALCIQLAVLASFVWLAVHFHRSCKRAGHLPANLAAVLHTLYASSALIGARTIFRTVEYFLVSSLNFYKISDPSKINVLLRYEWYFWVFEAMLMVLNTFLLNVRHPMRFLPRDIKIYLAQDGKTEVSGPGYGETRKFWVTLVDPFDLAGMFKGRKMSDRFWETHGQDQTTAADEVAPVAPTEVKHEKRKAETV